MRIANSIMINSDLPVVYGPIFSRRLGRSLSINILPGREKTCSFDCVYCECGRTATKTLFPQPETFPSSEQILVAIERTLKKPLTIDHVTFSGNGEPTLHPDFLKIAQETIALVKKLKPSAKLALLTNSSTFNKPDILQALQHFDKLFMKLDAADQDTFLKINQPTQDVNFEKIIDFLKSLPSITIQTAVFSGEPGNDSLSHIKRLVEVLAYINPGEVHFYTLDRPAWHPGIKRTGNLADLILPLISGTGLRFQIF